MGVGCDSVTVSAAQKFTAVSYSGSGGTWSNYADLEYGDTGEATAPLTVYIPNTKTLLFSVPNFITSIDYGSEFVSLKVTFQDKQDITASNTATCYGRLTGGSWISTGDPGATYTNNTLDGDSTYWGLSGTPQSIFTGLKNGSIKFEFKGEQGYGTLYIKEVIATLTYKLADTKRAALIITT